MVKTALLLGNYRPTFILARALKARGYKVICGLDGYDRGAEVSRYVDAVWDHSSFAVAPEEFSQKLKQLLADHPEIDAVYPITEPLIRAFADGRLVLPSSVALGSMPGPLVLKCLDKRSLLTMALEHGIPTASFAETNDSDDLYEKAEAIGFPLVVRPIKSKVFSNFKKAVTCSSLDELQTHDSIWAENKYQLLIQKHVSGKRDNIYFAADKGEIRRYLHAKITRTDQPDGSGLAVEGETIPPCTKIQRYTAKLVSTLAYDGIGCAQYLVDSATGEINLLELNPRIAGNHALPEACGLGLSDWLIDQCEGNTHDTSIIMGQADKRYTWLAGEIGSIKHAWISRKLTARAAIGAGYKAFRAFRRADLDMGFVSGDRMPGLVTLSDSFPFFGGISRRRFHSPFFSRLFIRKARVT